MSYESKEDIVNCMEMETFHWKNMERLRDDPIKILPNRISPWYELQWQDFYYYQVEMLIYYKRLPVQVAHERAYEACLEELIRFQSSEHKLPKAPKPKICAGCGQPIDAGVPLGDGAWVHYGRHYGRSCADLYDSNQEREQAEAVAALARLGIDGPDPYGYPAEEDLIDMGFKNYIGDNMKMVGDIKVALNCISKEHNSGVGLTDGEWTKRIKTSLGELGKKRGFDVYGASKENNKGEFLFDLCWLDYDDDEWLIRAPLILESEWGNSDDIDDDFQKLLLGQADLRVMVFGVRTEREFDETIIRLGTWVLKFKAGVSPSKYLLCGWCSEIGEFKFEEIEG